ncbi:uracil-xanthine permease family protein [Eubacterium coprostanoligenes]|uniref:Uracil permease n=1 Tax=Eubacterium coprostanoligenes TaxID=290054 RepID=A0A1T4KX42_9FIRM|nr:uracil-xanthine permease family protein [Eubacterium coprostanoligenes]MCI6253217.1 uracil-xanthine permease family protein [Eubacterium coprostanoligenes]MCI6353976.1 uracil-xanthine permease family protein [Eubacterium coprostanoligenes]MCI6361828.1 uracil-xanthine permease family protein [Eubacterium coprostanoligenes]MCI7265402.1 uracil-xanthine permease family protein [Eubacterium coprostanoligenes]MDD7358525.1 uracil-xanthine permease family protein [Eubacterium coprostanoligenes]
MAKTKSKIKIGKDGIYDARQLGTPKMLLLGFQHMFAMFGATVTVPLLTGLSISTTLLFAGLGTLLFHCLTKFKVPAFLGSSFAFIGGYLAVAPLNEDGSGNKEMLPYACLGVACAGLVYLIVAAFIKAVGVNRVMKLFPPVVTGPIIMAIGLGLAPSAVNNCSSNWWLAIVALALVIIFNIFGKGMIKIIPILLGIIGAYLVAVLVGNVGGVENFAIDFSAVKAAPWIGNPVEWSSTVFGGVSDKSKAISAIIAIVPIAIATMMEHIGDISAISATCNKNFINDPGLNRTLLGDGLATTLASLFGAPANTTYGENTGVLALSKVYDPRVIRIAAYFAIFFSLSPKFAALIESIPMAVVGGISFVLYGMISAIGVRNVVEAKVDFSKARNTIIAAVILVVALGLSGGITFTVGSVTITLSSLACASIAGIVLNIIFPEKDFDPDKAFQSDTVSAQVNVKSDYGKNK